jgi:hypothetical protein
MTSINQNTSVVNVGRTTPVTPGAQIADKSIPVVMATDQTSIPVIEQNKVQSEVALSLLGIPRAEIALGIFADVNTYDVNPSEWSMKPEYHVSGDGIKHLPTEAGALVEASRNKVAVLTSKRFFRYQPGRVSAATFGIKSSVSNATFSQNPSVRKFGIYDKYDGYYWESRNDGEEDNFAVVRRTQSLQYAPISPYGVGGETGTLLRGEKNLKQTQSTSLDRLGETQLDDYRIVGLGERERADVVETLLSDRNKLKEKRFELVDSVLSIATGNGAAVTGSGASNRIAGYAHSSRSNTGSKTTAGNKTYTATNDFYDDLAAAYNAELAYHVGGNPVTSSTDYLVSAEQMEAKCKRDLDYWIDNFLLDLEYGGDAHTKWNTTNFELSTGAAGNWQKGTAVGVFPRISAFESLIHKALLDAIHHNTILDLSADGLTRLKELQTIVANAFGNAAGTAGDGVDPTYDNDFDVVTPTDYGVRTSASEKLETFMTTKRNFWAYYVTTKRADDFDGTTATPINTIETGKTYTVLAGNNNLSTVGGINAASFAGHTFVATGNATISTSFSGTVVAETIKYTMPGGVGSNQSGGTSGNVTGTALAPFAGLTEAQLQEVIKNKCQRDVGYVVDGYKNDLAGGGNAETTYNASMFVRGTGLSVYSQTVGSGAAETLSEISRHAYLRDIIAKDLRAFGASAEVVSTNPTDDSGLFKNLADKIIGNFTTENQTAIEIGNKGFPGNLVVLRDGLVHTHAAVYDPSLLKDSKPVKAIATGVSGAIQADSALAVFKLTEGTVTFGQHVKISWTGTATELQCGETSGIKIFKGEVLRVRRVIGPKGNEFTLVKEDRTPVNNAFTSVRLSDTDINNATTVGTFYIDTVVPFIFPKDYDIVGTIGNNNAGSLFTSEIDTTYQTLVNNASGYTGTLNDALNAQREFRTLGQTIATGAVPRGAMFPYMYAFNDNLLDGGMENGYIGFVNTALNPGNTDNINIIRSQIDNVNFYPEYVNWIKNNVKPEYWGVYEYRVPRSRFSHDALDGISDQATDKAFNNTRGKRTRVYSDVATGSTGTVRPGENFTEIPGVPVYQNSLYRYDFTKVTMLKIEFSWYGAVGALFLAYVPVGNGEARWVRVHHLRASNQLKIASLGNATLPITYTTYGGGSEYCLGDGEDTTYQSDYQTNSHNIVKYGASYYIDGGDRGTVRLYSHNNDDTVSARGKRFAIGQLPSSVPTDTIDSETNATPYLEVTETYPVTTLVLSSAAINGSGLITGLTAAPSLGNYVEVKDSNIIADGIYRVQERADNTSIRLTDGQFTTSNPSTTPQSAGNITGTLTWRKRIDPTFYIGAKLKTDNALDQNIKVCWAETTGTGMTEAGRVYLTGTPTTLTGVSLLADRSASVYGIETKKTILSTREQNAVRNRVQVYPTKLSSANLTTDNTNVRLRFKKTPTFQTNDNPTGTFTLTADFAIDASNNFLPINTGNSGDYLNNGEETYGWFRGRIGSEFITVFGRLHKEADNYYFQLLESYEGVVTLVNGSTFMSDCKFLADGTKVAYSTTLYKTAYEKEGLSSVKIASNSVVPIPNTGVNVATLYLRSGTEQFDLDTYFDYNKEYLSFPLTDIADTLYFAVDSDTASTNTDEISLGVTWEEQ